MITFLVRRRHRYTLDAFLATHGRRLPFACRVLPYEHALRARRLPAGTYVFGDLDRLDGAMRRRAAEVWRALDGASGVRLLNDPIRSMRRYELLRALHERGWNDFEVVRLSEGRMPERWPVFLRGEDDHLGNVSALLGGPVELAKAVAELEASGRGREDHLAIGFRPERAPGELYAKRAAFIVGDRIVPRHVFFDRHWLVKEASVVDDALAARELEAVVGNPDEAHLLRVARLARIEYGRVDYGVVDGRVQVYEINTNPGTVGGVRGEGPRARVHQHFAAGFIDALAAVEEGGGAPVALPRPTDGLHGAREFALDHLSDVFRALGVERFEPRFQAWLYARAARRRRRR